MLTAASADNLKAAAVWVSGMRMQAVVAYFVTPALPPATVQADQTAWGADAGEVTEESVMGVRCPW